MTFDKKLWRIFQQKATLFMTWLSLFRILLQINNLSKYILLRSNFYATHLPSCINKVFQALRWAMSLFGCLKSVMIIFNFYIGKSRKH